MTKKSQKRVLVLDADMVPCLTIVRSLHKHGITPDIGYADAPGPKPLTAYSRCHGAEFRYPDPLQCPEQYADSIISTVRSGDYDLVIPVTERSMVPLARSNELPGYLDRIAMPDPVALEQVLVKERTLEIADEVDVPYPSRQLISDQSQLREICGDLDYPVVIKPLSSISEDQSNRRVQHSVDYAFDATELYRKGSNLLQQTAFLAQEYVGGIGVGIELIADDGEVKYAFQHQRIHELPLSGGGSCYRMSVPVDPDLLFASRKLITALDWHGVAMVEFKKDPLSGRFWLMEINGRFWGSLPLAVASGADFPYLLYQLYTTGEIPADTPPPREKIHCRKLSADIVWYEQVLRGQGDPRLFTPPTRRALLSAAGAVFMPGHRFDVQSLSDIRPGLVDIYRIITGYTSRVTDALKERHRLKYHVSGKTQRKIVVKLKQSHNILFLCYGNINRSAVAEMLLKSQFHDTDIDVRSAGFHPVAGRPADKNMAIIAAESGGDMSSSSSRIVDGNLLDWSDIVFVMELRHIDRVNEEYQGHNGKCFLLGSLTPAQGNPEIYDPYGKPQEIYRSCFRRIEASIAHIRRIIDGKQI